MLHKLTAISCLLILIFNTHAVANDFPNLTERSKTLSKIQEEFNAVHDDRELIFFDLDKIPLTKYLTEKNKHRSLTKFQAQTLEELGLKNTYEGNETIQNSGHASARIFSKKKNSKEVCFVFDTAASNYPQQYALGRYLGMDNFGINFKSLELSKLLYQYRVMAHELAHCLDKKYALLQDEERHVPPLADAHRSHKAEIFADFLSFLYLRANNFANEKDLERIAIIRDISSYILSMEIKRLQVPEGHAETKHAHYQGEIYAIGHVGHGVNQYIKQIGQEELASMSLAEMIEATHQFVAKNAHSQDNLETLHRYYQDYKKDGVAADRKPKDKFLSNFLSRRNNVLNTVYSIGGSSVNEYKRLSKELESQTEKKLHNDIKETMKKKDITRAEALVLLIDQSRDRLADFNLNGPEAKIEKRRNGLLLNLLWSRQDPIPSDSHKINFKLFGD